MRRRELLVTGGVLTPLAAGCLETLRREDAWRELVVDPPERVYVPPKRDEMVTYDSTTVDGRDLSLAASRPHSFWVVTDDERNRADVREADAIHLMVTVDDAESGTIVPTPVSTTIEPRDDTNTESHGRNADTQHANAESDERTLWPMLSQRMGAHYGDNVPLEAEGSYVATIRIGRTDADAIGPDSERLDDSTVADLEFEYDAAEIDSLERTLFDADDGRGDPGALEPMADHGDHGDNASVDGERDHDDPGIDAGTRVGIGTSGDIVFPATLLEDDRNGPTGHILAVPALTRYNSYPLAFATATAAITRDGESVAEATLRETIDTRYGHYYTTPIDSELLERGDTLVIGVDVPPQIARHEGYETTFLETEPATITLEEW